MIPPPQGPTSARKAVQVTLWISYTLFCVHPSAFITRGSRGPTYFAMELGKETPKGPISIASCLEMGPFDYLLLSGLSL